MSPPIAKPPLPARRCAVCPRCFIPTRERQKACGYQCGRILSGRTLAAKGPSPALLRQQRLNRITRKRYIEQITREQFGELSARDVALFNFAAAEGYRRAYGRAYNAGRRKERRHLVVLGLAAPQAVAS